MIWRSLGQVVCGNDAWQTAGLCGTAVDGAFGTRAALTLAFSCQVPLVPEFSNSFIV
jgi:hypothetical protein